MSAFSSWAGQWVVVRCDCPPSANIYRVLGLLEALQGAQDQLPGRQEPEWEMGCEQSYIHT